MEAKLTYSKYSVLKKLLRYLAAGVLLCTSGAVQAGSFMVLHSTDCTLVAGELKALFHLIDRGRWRNWFQLAQEPSNPRRIALFPASGLIQPVESGLRVHVPGLDREEDAGCRRRQVAHVG